MHAESLQSCLTLCDPVDCNLPGSSLHGDSPGKNFGVDCYAFLQGIFLTQGLNLYLLCLLYWQEVTLPLSSIQFNSVTQWCLTLRPHESQHARPPCPLPTPGVYPLVPNYWSHHLQIFSTSLWFVFSFCLFIYLFIYFFCAKAFRFIADTVCLFLVLFSLFWEKKI